MRVIKNGREMMLNALARMDTQMNGNKNVVVIDDSHETLQIVSKMLMKWNSLKVSLFDNEMNAISSIVADEPDLIILDIKLNTLDGLKVSNLLSSKLIFRVPIIFMTSDEIFIEKYRKSNPANKILKKPIDQSILNNTVEEILFREKAA